ncbi:glycine-tRNA synthetase, beta subunit [Escherichia coli]|uniref:Glycine-tRNA synthetase, beta subunit n=1 Tax=Escherichia coli TaxID=562 RepID=A0A485J984_ECOLX|nr:glycine-tRNA synthetase, beta subunit [Escherichia coli]
MSAVKSSPITKNVKRRFKADAEEAARKIGGNADLSESLLEEVASLVEWPGCADPQKFEEKFLAVPSGSAGLHHER